MADSQQVQYLLDTHVLLRWYSDSKKQSKEHRRLLARIEARGLRVGISAISLWEIAVLVARGRLRLDIAVDDFLASIEQSPAIEIMPISARVALDSTRLGQGFPRDPADQIIAATARCHALTLLTADDPIRESGAVRVR